MKKTKDRVYVEKREKEGGFAVRKESSKRASAVARTQKQAIKIAKKENPGSRPDVERVKHTNRGTPGRWRKA
jgi:hypothetical protein